MHPPTCNEQQVGALQQLHVHAGEAVEEGLRQALAPTTLLRRSRQGLGGRKEGSEDAWVVNRADAQCPSMPNDKWAFSSPQRQGLLPPTCSGFCAPNTRNVGGQRKVRLSSGMNTWRRRGREGRGELKGYATSSASGHASTPSCIKPQP